MPKRIRRIRCSSLDMLFGCAPSVLADGPTVVRIKSSNDAARIGKAVHEMAASFVESGGFDIAAAAQAQSLSESEESEAGELMGYVARAWGELSKYFENPRTEVVVESDVIGGEGSDDYKIIGTTDIVSPIGTTDAIILDWKSGYLDDGYHQQMAGYAYATWCRIGKPEQTKISVVVVFARHRYYKVVSFDATRLKEWEYDLVHNVLAAGDKYQPGKQCRFCELYATCSARRHEVGGTLDAMMFGKQAQDDDFKRFIEEATSMLAGLTEENKSNPVVAEVVTKLLYRMRLGAQVIEDTKNMLRAAVERVGPVPLGQGTSLVVREVEVRSLDANHAMKVLRNRLSDSQICSAMKLSLPQLLSAYANQYARGQKSAAREQLEQELADANAITHTVRKRMEEIDTIAIEPTPPDQEAPNAPGSEPAHSGDSSG